MLQLMTCVTTCGADLIKTFILKVLEVPSDAVRDKDDGEEAVLGMAPVTCDAADAALGRCLL